MHDICLRCTKPPFLWIHSCSTSCACLFSRYDVWSSDEINTLSLISPVINRKNRKELQDNGKWRDYATFWLFHHVVKSIYITSLLARFMGPAWGPPGDDRLAPWTLLSGMCLRFLVTMYAHVQVKYTCDVAVFHRVFQIIIYIFLIAEEFYKLPIMDGMSTSSFGALKHV